MAKAKFRYNTRELPKKCGKNVAMAQVAFIIRKQQHVFLQKKRIELKRSYNTLKISTKNWSQ